MLNCLILKIIVLIKRKFNIMEKDVFFVKTKDMQHYIREKINFDKKLFKK